jgi:predicted CoA-binding protein
VPAVASLDALDGPVDLVDVFRRPEHLTGVAEQAVAIGAGGLWLQQGLRSTAARQLAADAGLAYVEDRCLAVEVDRRGARPPAA